MARTAILTRASAWFFACACYEFRVRAREPAYTRVIHWLFYKAILMSGHRWTRPRCGARNRSNRLPCQAAGIGPSFRCRWHGGMSCRPARPKSPAGLVAISAAAKLTWERYRARKALGLLVSQVGRPKRPQPTPRALRAKPTATERRQRVIADLKIRYPDRSWD